jgi:hypothetical protein
VIDKDVRSRGGARWYLSSNSRGLDQRYCGKYMSCSAYMYRWVYQYSGWCCRCVSYQGRGAAVAGRNCVIVLVVLIIGKDLEWVVIARVALVDKRHASYKVGCPDVGGRCGQPRRCGDCHPWRCGSLHPRRCSVRRTRSVQAGHDVCRLADCTYVS